LAPNVAAREQAEVGMAGPRWRDKPRWYAKYAKKARYKIRANAEEEEEEEEEEAASIWVNSNWPRKLNRQDKNLTFKCKISTTFPFADATVAKVKNIELRAERQLGHY
jgi:hypothetical protein